MLGLDHSTMIMLIVLGLLKLKDASKIWGYIKLLHVNLTGNIEWGKVRCLIIRGQELSWGSNEIVGSIVSQSDVLSRHLYVCHCYVVSHHYKYELYRTQVWKIRFTCFLVVCWYCAPVVWSLRPQCHKRKRELFTKVFTVWWPVGRYCVPLSGGTLREYISFFVINICLHWPSRSSEEVC